MGYFFGRKSCHCCGLCPQCDSACLSVTLSGFSGTAAGCACANINGTYLLTRGRGREVTVTVTTATGSGATFNVILGWDDATATHFIASVAVVEGGMNYIEGDLPYVVFDEGELVCSTYPELAATVVYGAITAVEVVKPGKFVFSSDGGPGDPCVYSFCDMVRCGTSWLVRDISLAITSANRVLSVTFDGVEVARGEIDAEGNPCIDMTFASGEFTGTCSAGSAVVETAGCGGPPPKYCDPCTCFLTSGFYGNNYMCPPCGAYLYYGNGPKPAAIPFGLTGEWPGPYSSIGTGGYSSVCGAAHYLDYIAAGEPAEHIHLTTQDASVVMTTNYGLTIEVFLDENCCPTSIQVEYPWWWFDISTAIELRFGPATIADFFDVAGHDLYICEEMPLGVCCIGTYSIGTGIGQFYCETTGDGVTPGTWYEDGAYDPKDPCSGDPFP